MTKKNLDLANLLNGTATEEDVKHYFATFFEIKYDTAHKIDLYAPQVFFEFKFDKNLQNLPVRAKCFAQAMYYARNLKFGLRGETRSPTNFISVVTKNLASILPFEIFAEYYSDKKIFDWDLPPNTPCKKLIAALAEFQALRDCIIYDFSDTISNTAFIDRTRAILADKRPPTSKTLISEINFQAAFDSWQKKIGKYIPADERKPSEYFLTDIEAGKSELIGTKTIRFHMNDGSNPEKNSTATIHNSYNGFWSNYEKISDQRKIVAIRQKMDRMTKEDLRRRTGEFYTPIAFAEKAIDYLERTIDIDWRSGNFRLWDMAAGSGNLEDRLPADALPFCYISTLNPDDAAYCQKIYPAATCFQYDYLNDDVEFLGNPCATGSPKMPANLAADLQNPKLKWIIFINPPYATANNYERDKSKLDKDEVSFTAIQKLMTEAGMGEVSRELFSQFLYRISLEFKNRKAWLGMFSKLKYINSTNDQTLRDNFFHYKFESGFVFSSKNFEGCKANFPVGFLIWNLAENILLETQKIVLDIFNEGTYKVGTKSLNSEKREEFLSKWIERPPATKKFPPLSSALTVAAQNKDRRDRIAEDFLASMMCNGNDFMHQNRVTFLSGPYVSAGGMSVTPENFAQCMIVHMVRRLPKATWLNDRDQFMQPTQELPAGFITDAVIWSLFAASNQTASLRDVEYEGQKYRLKNNLYPWRLAEISAWKMPEKFSEQILAAEDRFAALWLAEHAAEITTEGAAVLAEAKRIYKVFYAEFEAVDATRWKIEDWDVGWYQLRMALNNFRYDRGTNFKAAWDRLGAKLLPQIYELGFLRDEVKYFGEDFE